MPHRQSNIRRDDIVLNDKLPVQYQCVSADYANKEITNRLYKVNNRINSSIKVMSRVINYCTLTMLHDVMYQFPSTAKK